MSKNGKLGTNEAISNGDSVRSISRAFRLLELFDKDNPHRHVRDLAHLTGIPRTTVLRLLGTLEANGFVLQVAESTYQVGPGALRWFQVIQDAWSLPAEVLQEVRTLRDETRESVNVYVRQGHRRVSIGQAEGTRTVRSVVPLGTPLSLSAGSSGTILLAHAPASELPTLITMGADFSDIERKIERYHKRGFAISHGERESGASSLSLPLHCTNGAVAALSISGPSARFADDRIETYLEAGKESIARIETLGLGPVEALLAHMASPPPQ